MEIVKGDKEKIEVRDIRATGLRKSRSPFFLKKSGQPAARISQIRSLKQKNPETAHNTDSQTLSKALSFRSAAEDLLYVVVRGTKLMR
jgi:hypothetical protein